MTHKISLLFIFLATLLFLNADEFNDLTQAPGAIMFTPPEGWRLADKKGLPENVDAMVLGKSDSNFPPSINLAHDEAPGGIQEYMKIIRQINEADGVDWKDLGTIRTQAGDARLLQLDLNTEWGQVREMQVVFVKAEKAFILTAAALKNEFSQFYKDFFSSLRSLKINRTLIEMIPDRRRQQALERYQTQTISALKTGQTTTDNLLAEFKQKLSTEYSDMNDDWRERVLKEIQEQIIQ